MGTRAPHAVTQDQCQSLTRLTQSLSLLSDHYPLAPWAGFAVLCGYAALAMGLARFLFRRRDA